LAKAKKEKEKEDHR